MKIKRLLIRNFRSIRSLNIDLDDTTVFIGPNNAGKSAILDAVRIALSRRWGKRGTGFTEHDVHLPQPDLDPRTLPPVEIQVQLEDSADAPWPDDMVAALDNITALSPTGRNLISLRVTCSWSNETESFEPRWEFLDAAGNALTGKSQRATNLTSFFEYLPLFWLSALRDAGNEFSPRSSLWGGFLRGIKIPKELESRVMRILNVLDKRLLVADPQLGKAADSVGKATRIAVGDSEGAATLRMLPMNLEDLLTRASVVLRNEETRPWLPLDHHGQGLQSLSVIFLFRAAVVQQLALETRTGVEPVFAIEEPDVHLHPQAARTLWPEIVQLPGQHLITTHSPYFVQNIPIHTLRIVRLESGCSKISSIPRRIDSTLPWTEKVAKLAQAQATMFKCDPITHAVSAVCWFDDRTADCLANCWRHEPNEAVMREAVDKLRHSARLLMSEEDQRDLAVAGRRVRGEIFFARRWILVEGQTEYLLLHALGKAYHWSLDQHGVAVIDFQNNGNPGVYAALAEAFAIPWDMITDGDPEGQKFRAQLLKRGFCEDELTAHLETLPTPCDLEDQLIADGHEQLLREIVADLTSQSARTCTLEEFRGRLNNEKPKYMSILAAKIESDIAIADRMPSQFVSVVKNLKVGSL